MSKVFIQSKHSKVIQINEEITILELLEATEEAWNYVSGTHQYFDPKHVNLDGSMGRVVSVPSWPDHKESGGIVQIKEGYSILGIEKVRKSTPDTPSWGLDLWDKFYTSLRFLGTEQSGDEVLEYGLFFGDTMGYYPVHTAWDSDYNGLTEVSKYDFVGFSYYIRTENTVVTGGANRLAEILGYNPEKWKARGAYIAIPA